MLGDLAAGKTSLINWYSKKDFITDDHLARLGLDFVSLKYTTKCDNNEIHVKIWDTAGQERFRIIPT